MDDEERRRLERAEDDRRAEQRREEQRRAHLQQEEAHRRRSLCTSCGLLTAMAAGKCSLCGAADAGNGPVAVTDPTDRFDDGRLDATREHRRLEDQHYRATRCIRCGLFTATIGGLCSMCVDPDDDAERQARADLVERFDDEQREALWQQASAGAASYDEARDRFWALAEQAAGRTDDLLRAQMAAYSRELDQTPQLNDLWERACLRADGERRSYEDARRVFWRSVNRGEDDDARWVRAMLDAAGFDLGTGSRAPRLREELVTGTGSVDPFERALDIDHKSPRSLKHEGADPALETAASNLRFMLAPDNRCFRRDDYGADDRLRPGRGRPQV